jgi:hypothetical protein
MAILATTSRLWRSVCALRSSGSRLGDCATSSPRPTNRSDPPRRPDDPGVGTERRGKNVGLRTTLRRFDPLAHRFKRKGAEQIPFPDDPAGDGDALRFEDVHEGAQAPADPASHPVDDLHCERVAGARCVGDRASRDPSINEVFLERTIRTRTQSLERTCFQCQPGRELLPASAAPATAHGAIGVDDHVTYLGRATVRTPIRSTV